MEVSLINITEDAVYFCVLLSTSVGWVFTQYKMFAVFGASLLFSAYLTGQPHRIYRNRFSFRRVEVSNTGLRRKSEGFRMELGE